MDTKQLVVLMHEHPRSLFNNIIVRPSMRDQILTLVTRESMSATVGGFDVRTSEYLPDNYCVFRDGDKVIGVLDLGDTGGA